MNQLKIFSNSAFGNVRTVISEKGEFMFCLADICKAVELTNAPSVKNRLDKDDTQLVDLHDINPECYKYGNSLATFVNETGFYEVLLFSSSPKVKPFRRWVTSEVLPSIRKTGGYIYSDGSESNEEIMARALMVAQETLKRRDERIAQLARENSEQRQQIAENEPKVNFAKAVENSENLILIREMAKILKQNGVETGGDRFREQLMKDGFLTKSGEPSQRSMELKIMRVVESTISTPSRTFTSLTPKITGKGQTYFLNRYAFANKQPELDSQLKIDF